MVGATRENLISAMSDPQVTREHRNRVIKGGAILSGLQHSAVNCLVRNMHKNGAELRVDAEAQIPKEFLLYVAVDSIAYRCTLRWRKLDRCGVEFSGTEPKPHWHYG